MYTIPLLYLLNIDSNMSNMLSVDYHYLSPVVVNNINKYLSRYVAKIILVYSNINSDKCKPIPIYNIDFGSEEGFLLYKLSI